MLLPFPSGIDDNKSGANHTFVLFCSLRRFRRNRRAKSFCSHHGAGGLIVCNAVRMHGHVSHIDKPRPQRWITATQIPNTHTHPHPPTLTQSNDYNFYAHESTTSMTLSFYSSQTTRGTSSDVAPSAAPPFVSSFGVNQARRADVAGELETLRGCTYFYESLSHTPR